MKIFIAKLIEFIIDLLKNDTKEQIEQTNSDEQNNLDVSIETNNVESSNTIIEVKTINDVYECLNNKQRQTYLKKLGFYTKKIDNIRGSGQKLAEKQFNTIFLNVKSDKYTESTDKLLRIIYEAYCKSPYMTNELWKYFKNFKFSEFHCTCKKKYCNGWNGLKDKLPIRLVIEAQYERNYYNAPVNFSSTVRCKKRNKEVGGTSNSRHMYFRAGDRKCGKVKAKDIVNMVYKNSKTKLPFVSYAYAITTYYAHVDVKI